MNVAFESISIAEVEAEDRGQAARPEDNGGDTLPFDQLGGRRFEILAYRLLSTSLTADDSATLVKTTGDRGRDVLLHRKGHLHKVVQCKNQRAAMTRPDVLFELITFALHAASDANILPPDGNNLEYDLWCPSGFTEPASQLVDTWPAEWSEPSVREKFDEVVSEFAHFSGHGWDTVRDFLLTLFPTRVRPRKVTAIDITAMVRSNPDVYRDFFRGQVVADMETIQQALFGALASAEYRKISDDDIRRILDRIQSQPKDARLHLLFGYVLGVAPTLLASMEPAELKEFAINCMAPVYRNATLLGNVAVRICHKKQAEIKAKLSYKNRNFLYVLNQVATFRVLAGVQRVGFLPTLFRRNPLLDTSADLSSQIGTLCRQVWDEMPGILARPISPPHFDPSGRESDEHLRRRVAAHAIQGYNNRDLFEAELLADFRRNDQEIRGLISEIESILPTDFVIIADSRSAFEDKALLARFAESVKLIEELKKGQSALDATSKAG